MESEYYTVETTNKAPIFSYVRGDLVIGGFYNKELATARLLKLS